MWRESTMTGGINHQHQFASVIGHRDGLAIETGGSELMKGGHTGILKYGCITHIACGLQASLRDLLLW